MKPFPPMLTMLLRLWRHLSARRRSQFGLLLILIVAASIMEIFSIGAIFPFLGALISPERVYEHPVAQIFIQILGIDSPEALLLPLTLVFVTIVILSAATRLLLIWATTKLTFATGADLSIDIYRRTLYQPYATHIARNSSEVIGGITAKSHRLIHNAVMPAVTIISASITLSMILSALVFVSPAVSLIALLGFSCIYLTVIQIVKRRLYASSQRIAKESTNIIKALQEGLGGIRDVLIDGSQEKHCEIYQDADLALRRAQGKNAFVAQSPRLMVEALGMVLIIAVAFWLTRQPGSFVTAIPVLGVLAMGAQRTLPVLQQAYGAWASLQGEIASVSDAIDLLDQPMPNHAGKPPSTRIPFEDSIELSGLSFQYDVSGPWIFKNVSLEIPKGARIGFVGATGSGKSTLLDVIMGLLEPTNGQMAVDGVTIDAENRRGWQAHIAHVPQTIFLADCSIEENIAFGVPKTEIDHQRVQQVAQQAQLAEVIESLPQKYQTTVGERGVRFSGGQRQRIGIARALYRQASVIIFDEATSALDNETEASVMRAIDSIQGDITVLMIAHRISTLKNCTQIVELKGNRLKAVGTYADVAVGMVENT